jgi:hypothetical protein
MTQKLNAPDGSTAVTFAGEVFEVIEGIIEVPAEAVAELLSHGFTPWFAKRKRGAKQEQPNDQGGDQGSDENQGEGDQSNNGDQADNKDKDQ